MIRHGAAPSWLLHDAGTVGTFDSGNDQARPPDSLYLDKRRAGGRTDLVSSKRLRRVAVSMVLLAFVAGACGSGGGAPKVDSAVLMAELGDVPGYYYEKIGVAELTQQLGAVPDTVSSVSFRTVHRVGSRLEIAFLALFQTEDTATLEHEFAGWKETTIAGQKLRSGEFADTPQSRYRYAWVRPGVVAHADGPDDAEIRSWLGAHLAARSA